MSFTEVLNLLMVMVWFLMVSVPSRKDESKVGLLKEIYFKLLLFTRVDMLAEARHLTVFMSRPLAKIRCWKRSLWVKVAFSGVAVQLQFIIHSLNADHVGRIEDGILFSLLFSVGDEFR